MNCSNCIHYAVCHARMIAGNSAYADKFCQEFKNKNNIIEVVMCCHCDAFILTPTGSYCRKMSAIEDAARTPNDFCSYGERKEGA